MIEVDEHGAEWLVCTCAHGCGDTQPTTSPENCEYENLAEDEYHALDALRAQWRPNRATLDIEMVRRARAEREAAEEKGRPEALMRLLATATRTPNAGTYSEICAGIDRAYAKPKLNDAEHELRPKCKCCEWPSSAIAKEDNHGK